MFHTEFKAAIQAVATSDFQCIFTTATCPELGIVTGRCIGRKNADRYYFSANATTGAITVVNLTNFLDRPYTIDFTSASDAVDCLSEYVNM